MVTASVSSRVCQPWCLDNAVLITCPSSLALATFLPLLPQRFLCLERRRALIKMPQLGMSAPRRSLTLCTLFSYVFLIHSHLQQDISLRRVERCPDLGV